MKRVVPTAAVSVLKCTEQAERTMHHKYPSIANSYQSKFVAFVRSAVRCNEWIVTEKVHGANFMFFTNGDGTVDCGSRRRMLVPGQDKFYNYEAVLAKVRADICALFVFLKAETQVTVIGEIYGGHYPGAKSSDPRTVRVQKGVDYCPDNAFVAFDIVVDGTLVTRTTFDEAMAHTSDALQAAPVLLRTADLDEALSFDVETLQSRIPVDVHQLDPLANNVAEGVVIAPSEPHFLPNGKRAIFKKKSTRFTEVARPPKSPSGPKVQRPPSSVYRATLAVFRTYLNENRYDAVCSKHGEDYERDEPYRKRVAELGRDALKDFEDDGHTVLLTPTERMALRKAVFYEALAWMDARVG
jgi:Rnl2 family RNA ligase